MPHPQLKHIFFDLDHTLWDFETNSRETLGELMTDYSGRIGVDLEFDHFYQTYNRINLGLWKAFRESRIDVQALRHRRFREAFDELGVKEQDWVDDFDGDYMFKCPQKPHLMPTALHTLEQLKPHYPLHLITNGFLETQTAKLHHSGIGHFFGEVVTSDCAQAKKPDPTIFHYALEKAGARPENSLYVGDNYDADVKGGLNVGMEVVFFNPEGRENPLGVWEVKELGELLSTLL